jgi:acetolactate synthase-1/2/3 large subunit
MQNRSPRTVVEVLVDILEAVGIDACFGVPGGQTLPLYGVTRSRGFRHVMMRDERNCACAADAYARISGRVGVCDATVGPGVTNLVSGLAEAYASSIPVIALVADIETRLEHLRHRSIVAQAFEQRRLMESVSKWVGRVQAPDMLVNIMAHALRVATTGRSGPVVVEIPEEIWSAPLTAFALSGFDKSKSQWPRHRPSAPSSVIREAIACLRDSKRPIVLAGGGVMASNAYAEVTAFADEFQIPVVTSLNGKGAIDERHPLSWGVVGQFGIVTANCALLQADCVLAIGSKFTTFNSFSWRLPHKEQKVVHIDTDGEELNRSISTHLEILADAKEASAQILDGLRALRRTFKWQLNGNVPEQPGTASDDPDVAPEDVVSAMNDVVAERTILVSDASLASGWTASRYKSPGSGRKFIAPRGLAGIGWACGAAIGAALAAPKGTRIVLVAGDGSAAYWLGEMETAVRYNLPITFVILNNSGFGWIIQCEKQLKFSNLSTFSPVDYAAIGVATGARSIRARTIDEFRTGLRQALAHDGPFVLDALTSQRSDATVSYESINPDGATIRTAYSFDS